MSDHDMDPRLHAWVRSPVEPTAPVELRRQVLAIPTTGSTARRRRFRLLPGPKPTAGADGRRDQTRRSAPPTTNHIGGTSSMFSATKLVAVAASVALFGALTLALPLGQQQDALTPAAEAPAPGAVTSFTGEMELLGQDRSGDVDRLDWGYSTTGAQWTTRLTTTDPRFSGLSTGFHNIYQTGPDRTELRAFTSREFTEEGNGTWRSTGYGYQDPETTGWTYLTNSIGEGAYEGLSAVSTCEQQDGSNTMACHGIIFEGQWPEFPIDAPDAIRAPYGTP